MDLNPQGFNIVRAVGTTREVRQIKLDLVPSLIQPHRHSADKWLHAGRTLIVTRSETTSHVLVIQHLNLKRKVFLQILDDHHKKRELNPQRLTWIRWASDVVGGHIRSHYLKHT
jgi:hypothetical protein